MTRKEKLKNALENAKSRSEIRRIWNMVTKEELEKLKEELKELDSGSVPETDKGA